MQVHALLHLVYAGNVAMTRLALDWARRGGVSQDMFLDILQSAQTEPVFVGENANPRLSLDGFLPGNDIGALTKAVAAAITVAPQDADLILPQTIMTTLRNLKPRG
jgi:hypothetical protein